MIFLSFSFLTVYGIVFAVLLIGFLKKNRQDNAHQNNIAINVIVPFRNEAQNLGQLVKAFEKLNYTNASYLFIDDHSTDDGFELLQRKLATTKLKTKIIKQSAEKSGKKAAIITGVGNAEHNWIVTTDADTIPSIKWLNQFALAFALNKQFVIGSVINTKGSNLLESLLNIEALMLSGVSIGSAKIKHPILCSGASLGYSKALFEQLTPYKDNMELTSGDDQFFLDKMIERKAPVYYLDSKEALVYTQPPSNYKALLNQAIRWSSKNKKLICKRSLYLSVLVFSINILVIVNLLSFVVLGYNTLAFLVLKFFIDTLFLGVISFKYKQASLIVFSPLIFLLYPIHLLIIFVSSFFLSVKWKERPIEYHE